MHHHNRILIVDDHPTNVALLEDILGDDYPLVSASSGEEALELALDFQPALILLDIMMPGLNGYETCRQLRAQATLRHTKIIMVSAKAMVSERLQGYEAGADDYITKPFDEDELLAKVRVYLRLKSVEEVEQLKSNLLVLLGTETRTPLNGILPILELLRSDDDMSPEERTMFLDMAYQSAKRLHRLIERCMILSEMKAGRWEFQRTPADLVEVVQDATCLVAPQAAERHVQIERILPTTAMALLDVDHMRDVVIALLENAIRFSSTDRQVVVTVAHSDEHVHLTVSNQGNGIEPDALPLVFEEFTQPDLDHHSEGQGLSLAIARQVVQAHHGTITVESTQGLETTFTVRVPVATPVDVLGHSSLS